MVLLRPVVNLLVRCVRWRSKTHYETLKVDRNATNKEIKDSFVKLSKELHPDKRPNDPASHNAFVKLNEAYRTLSKSDTRQIYDNQLRNQHFAKSQSSSIYTNHPGYWRDESVWEFRDRSKDRQYEGKPYYGIKDVGRMPNLWIASACIAFMFIGTLFQFYSIRFGRSILDEKAKLANEKNNEILREIKDRDVDIDTQLEILRANIEKRSKK